MRLALVILLAAAGCSRHHVSLTDRACDASACDAGFACFDGICRNVDDSGAQKGGNCTAAGAVAPCDTAVSDCSHGCMTCDEGVWGACVRDCAVLAPELIEPESCDGIDNDCDGTIDESDVAPSGCVQRYSDSDSDGYGVGTSRCACADDPTGFTATAAGDCDDHDDAVFPGAANPCNNCDTRAAITTDHDGDGITACGGDCNDSDKHVFPGNPEAVFAGDCFDGLDNNCNNVQDCAEPTCVWSASAYTYSRVLTVTPHPSLDANFGIRVQLDHKSLISSGHASDAGGRDLRVFYNDSGTFREIARQLEPGSAWSSPTTAIWFANQAPLTAVSTSYVLVYGQGSTLSNPPTQSDVFAFTDFFSGNGSLPAPWVVTGEGVDVSGSVATMANDDNPDSPTMSVTFAPVSNRVEVVIGTSFSGDESTYAVWMHAGTSLPDSTTQPDTTGSAAVFAWGNHADFGPSGTPDAYTAVTGVGSFTHNPLGASTGAHRLAAFIDFTEGTVVSSYDATSISIGLTDPTTTAVDELRFVAWDASNNITIGFRYVSVRAAPPAEATVTVGPEITTGPCQ